jgi:sirohydrochlorin cobaltochelatase
LDSALNHIPIVLAAFGTTTRAMKTYSFIHEVLQERFPENPVHWAFSSRIVKDYSDRHRKAEILHPHEVLQKLHLEGHPWAVVQSLHLMCGHEFYRLVEEVRSCPIRTSLGMPLLNEPEDYKAIVQVMSGVFSNLEEEAVVLVGHGTDHPSWCSYVALHHIFQETMTRGIYVGVVEHGYPTMASIVADVKAAGYRRVKLFPFLLVAGMHFEEDLSGEEDSWKRAFEEEEIEVSLESQGLGFYPGIVDLFCRHVASALDVIPGRG